MLSIPSELNVNYYMAIHYQTIFHCDLVLDSSGKSSKIVLKVCIS